MIKLPIWYTRVAASHATANWKNTVNAVSFHDLISLWITPIVATHGIYSRQNTISAYAFNAPYPISSRSTDKPDIPSTELISLMPNNMPKLDTTTSLAAMPIERNDHLPHAKSCGCGIGATALYFRAKADISVTIPDGQVENNQTITDAANIVVPPY